MSVLHRAEIAWPEYRDVHPANNTPEQRHAFIAGYCAREREFSAPTQPNSVLR